MQKLPESLFKNKAILEEALTHKSWINENPSKRNSNERLEFLGDAVLEFIVSKILFETFPNKEEGFLTALRANLVNTENLSRVAFNLSLNQKIYLSKGEDQSGGRENPSILADTLEAVIGALFLDRGIKACENFIKMYILNDLKSIVEKPLKDAKSLLQEVVQSYGFLAPRYKVIKEEGPDHAKIFTVVSIIDGKVISEGSGRSKLEAEKEAAQKALGKIEEELEKLKTKRV